MCERNRLSKSKGFHRGLYFSLEQLKPLVGTRKKIKIVKVELKGLQSDICFLILMYFQ